MNKFVIIVDKPDSFLANDTNKIISSQEYISNLEQFDAKAKNVKIINLSNSYDYLSRGYYVSLMAKARKQKCFPSIENIISVNWRRNYRSYFYELNQILEKNYNLPFQEPATRKFVSFFGRHKDPMIEPLSRRIFDLFRIPIASFEIKYNGNQKWVVSNLELKSYSSLVAEQVSQFKQDMEYFTGSAWRDASNKKKPEIYWIAVLHNPGEENSPSNKAALNRFIRVAKKMNVWAELITKDDFSSLLIFDGLFIRQTTAINDNSYRFAQKAESEGIVTIDSANSIIKCCNKVYLNEILEINKFDKPKTLVLDKKYLNKNINSITFPVVLKIPDGCFSLGVVKVNNKDELLEKASSLFDDSEVILCQEFIESDFDWRIGVLNNQVLFASKYYMAKNHWQIYNHKEKKAKLKYGNSECVDIKDVPPKIIKVAINSSKLIGDGLYGIDIKELKDGRAVIIEINDNPNIDHGFEDKILGDELYKKIIQHFINKIENIRKN